MDGRGVVAEALEQVGLDPVVAACETTVRGGLVALSFRVEDRPGYPSFPELIAAVRDGRLPTRQTELAVAAAERLAAAEEEVHGAPATLLHELAGLDTLVDLVVVVALLDALGPDRVVASPPALGAGTVQGSHGRLTVPAPAVLALLRGVPTAGTDAAEVGELTTPTGAALLTELTDAFGGLPPGRPVAVGVGAGDREVDGRPNVLRAVLVDEATTGDDGVPSTCADRLALVETTVDDTTPEYLSAAAERLRREGVRDVWLTPVVMKKGRPGVTVHALVDETGIDRAFRTLMEETTTFGVRVARVERRRLVEQRTEVTVDGEKVGVRLGYLDGELVTASPEYEDCVRAGGRLGIASRRVFERARYTAGN